MTTPLFKKRILLIDDETVLRSLYRETLEREGAEVEEAGSIQEALEKVRERPFDLIISDQRMPGGEGTDLLQALRSTGDNTRFMSCTGYMTTPPHGKWSADATLAKPFDETALVEMAEKVINAPRP